MTKIEGRPHDRLLVEMGFRGFPTLAFIDADGKLLAEPPGREVSDFATTLHALRRIDDVVSRAEAGDEGARVEQLLLENDLGRVEPQEFEERAATLRAHADEAQTARLDRALLDIEVTRLVERSYGEDLEGAARDMIAFLDAGKRPSKGDRSAGAFWWSLVRWADGGGHTAVLERCVAGMREDLPSDEQTRESIERLAGRVERLKERDVLVARRDGGEAGLAARILILEAGLAVIPYSEFLARRDEALAAANEAERDELEQSGVDLEFRELTDRIWGGDGRDAAGARMLEILEGDGLGPGEEVAKFSMTALQFFARRSGDPHLMTRTATALRRRFGESEPYGVWAKDLEAAAAEARDEG